MFPTFSMCVCFPFVCARLYLCRGTHRALKYRCRLFCHLPILITYTCFCLLTHTGSFFLRNQQKHEYLNLSEEPFFFRLFFTLYFQILLLYIEREYKSKKAFYQTQVRSLHLPCFALSVTPSSLVLFIVLKQSIAVAIWLLCCCYVIACAKLSQVKVRSRLVKVVTWIYHGFKCISQCRYIDFVELLHGFVKIIICISRPSPHETKMKFD